jgi:hypothetical protein
VIATSSPGTDTDLKLTSASPFVNSTTGARNRPHMGPEQASVNRIGWSTSSFNKAMASEHRPRPSSGKGTEKQADDGRKIGFGSVVREACQASPGSRR